MICECPIIAALWAAMQPPSSLKSMAPGMRTRRATSRDVARGGAPCDFGPISPFCRRILASCAGMPSARVDAPTLMWSRRQPDGHAWSRPFWQTAAPSGVHGLQVLGCPNSTSRIAHPDEHLGKLLASPTTADMAARQTSPCGSHRRVLVHRTSRRQSPLVTQLGAIQARKSRLPNTTGVFGLSSHKE